MKPVTFGNHTNYIPGSTRNTVKAVLFNTAAFIRKDINDIIHRQGHITSYNLSKILLCQI